MRHSGQSNAEEDRSGGLCGKFGGSKFYLAFLLMVSFLLLCVVPNMFFWFVEGPKNFRDDTPKDAVKVLYEISSWLMR